MVSSNSSYKIRSLGVWGQNSRRQNFYAGFNGDEKRKKNIFVRTNNENVNAFGMKFNVNWRLNLVQMNCPESIWCEPWDPKFNNGKIIFS